MVTKQRPRLLSVILGCLIVLGVIMSAVAIPHTAWVIIAGVLGPVPAALAGAWVAQKITPKRSHAKQTGAMNPTA
jgi:hypothetical protein